MPSSKQKVALAKILQKEGYITGFSVAPSTKGPGEVLTVSMKYSADRHRTISGLRRISTPGLRVYRKGNAVPRVLGGLGVAVLSTSSGTDDRPRGAQAQRGRRSPLLRVVNEEQRHVPNR